MLLSYFHSQGSHLEFNIFINLDSPVSDSRTNKNHKNQIWQSKKVNYLFYVPYTSFSQKKIASCYDFTGLIHFIMT